MPQRDLAFRLALLAAATSALASCASLGARPPTTVDLSGTWQLDETLSDDPSALLHRPRSGGGHDQRHRGGGDPGTMGPGGMYGQQAGGHHGGWERGRRGPGGDLLERPNNLAIRQSPTQLELVADGVPTRFVYGEKVIASVQGGAAERRAGWKGDEFVVEYVVTDGGPRATRDYELEDGGRQLVVTTHLNREEGPALEIRSVYERSAS